MTSTPPPADVDTNENPWISAKSKKETRKAAAKDKTAKKRKLSMDDVESRYIFLVFLYYFTTFSSNHY